MRSPVATSIAIAVGLVLLLGYFLPVQPLLGIRSVLLDWAVILAGVAGLIAIFNLVGVHWRKIRSAQDPDVYSPILIVAFGLTFVAGLVLGPGQPIYQKAVTSIQIPVEASLMAVVGISLAFASARLFQRRKGVMAVVFVMSTLVFLVLTSGFLTGFGANPAVRDLLSALDRLPLAGSRGILLGIGLGSLTTGLRILLGADRPYSG